MSGIRTIQPLKGEDGKDYYVVYMSTYHFDSLVVLKEFEGRNWRRIKRELRKVSDRSRVKATRS